MKYFYALLLLSLAGCATSAKLVERTHTPVKGGVINYDGALVQLEARAQDAKRLMAEYCGGDYKITKDVDKLEDSGTVLRSGGSTIGYAKSIQRPVKVIEFECKDQTTASIK